METRGLGRTPNILPPQALRTLSEQSFPADAAGPTDHFTPLLRRAPLAEADHNEVGAPPPEEAHSPEEPQAAAQRLRANVDLGNLTTLKDRRKELRANLKSLPRGAPLADQARIHHTLQETQRDLKGLERYKRERTWESLKGDGEPSPTYRNFFTTGRTPIQEMKEVLRVGAELADPNSPRRLRGNQIEVLTRGEIWQKKMELMETAARQPKVNGQPQNVDAEYFELGSLEAQEKLGRAARGGAHVRVLIDSGRLQPDGDNQDATNLATRLAAVRGLENGSRGQAGIQFFANQEVLGSRTDLMHRKLLRVGDTVMFGGMNANSGSGENVDSAMTIRGPAARQQDEGFQRDLERSQGRDAQAIFGTQLEDLRKHDNITVSGQGLLSLMEAAGSQAPRPGRDYAGRVDAALESASFQGVKASELADFPDEAAAREFMLKGRGSAHLTERGRAFLADGLEAAVERMRSDANRQRLAPGALPSDKVAGTDTVAVGDTSAERTAMLLHTIDTAQRHIDVSAFVVSEEVARALVDKRDRMRAEGKPFDVRVVLDPGTYGYGGTPNEAGYRYLEDHDLPVKWAVLDRSSPEHDRKVHAKLMVTDQMMLTGSTNFSSKALHDNWELSDVVYFGEDQASRDKQAELRGDFDRLWNREALSINTRQLAEQRYIDTPAGPERDLQIERFRSRTTRSFIQGVENYERAIGTRVQEELHRDPSLAFNLEQQVGQGKARGYALWELMGDERIQRLRESVPEYQALQDLVEHGPSDTRRQGP